MPKFFYIFGFGHFVLQSVIDISLAEYNSFAIFYEHFYYCLILILTLNYRINTVLVNVYIFFRKATQVQRKHQSDFQTER